MARASARAGRAGGGAVTPVRRSAVRSLGLVAAGALLAVALGGTVLLVDFKFAGGRIVSAAMGGGDLADACREPLAKNLAEKGFEPADIEFGPEPVLGSPWARARTFGDSFTFRDGAAAVRVDGVVACVVSASGATAAFRVASAPHRNA